MENIKTTKNNCLSSKRLNVFIIWLLFCRVLVLELKFKRRTFWTGWRWSHSLWSGCPSCTAWPQPKPPNTKPNVTFVKNVPSSDLGKWLSLEKHFSDIYSVKSLQWKYSMKSALQSLHLTRLTVFGGKKKNWLQIFFYVHIQHNSYFFQWSPCYCK